MSSPLVLVEESAPPPSGWVTRRRSPPDEPLELIVAVRQQNVHWLHASLMAASDPSSPATYGRHKSNDEVHALVAPAAADAAAVASYLQTHGLAAKHASPNGDLLSVRLSVRQAEALLSARYYEHVHAVSNTTAHRIVGGYRLPHRVAAAVDFVGPTVRLPSPRKAAPIGVVGRAALWGGEKRAGAPAFGSNVPATLRKLYSVGDAVGKAEGNRMAVTAFLEQYYSEAALRGYWAKYCDGDSLTCGKGGPRLVGDATTGKPGVESMLDIEAITGVAGNISSEFWGFSGRSPDNPSNEPFLKWLAQLSSTPDASVPKVFSSSYGEDEASWSRRAASRLNVEFMKAGSRGISLFYASGDEGANCKHGRFVPEGPGSSPYVTAVGGTTPDAGYPSPGGEAAVGLSSGGFSGYWPLQPWQEGAVKRYLAAAPRLPPASKGYNVSGRAYPDIAAQATNFCVEPFGCGVSGTSCASPTAAGIFALLNDVRLSAGKGTLGFVNPLLYQNAAALNDVTTGASRGCLFESGWPAAAGWDAVTGLGTPNFDRLAKVVLALP